VGQIQDQAHLHNFSGGSLNLSLRVETRKLRGWLRYAGRNRSCFDHKMIKDPVKLISYSTVFMKYWVGLHGEKDAEDLRLGADGLLKLATTPTAAGRARSMSG
jgi:hypothetical protein